ncbi:MAG: hypothetical protein KVP17_004656 [Porospora cf. gigantea B]|uniref:uncharacterized protein n=1 Tax=Porospora cf. gigantea B TaxID=2853592 RepID=UPI003571B14F|nr:MAG: hypothetical protein KVP17_004656 [Porospora cf. gigantea B]
MEHSKFWHEDESASSSSWSSDESDFSSSASSDEASDASGSEADSDDSSSSLSSLSEAVQDEDHTLDKYQLALRKWGKKTEEQVKAKEEIKRERKEREEQEEAQQHESPEAKSRPQFVYGNLLDMEVVDTESIMEKLKQLALIRNRKGAERNQLVNAYRKLTNMARAIDSEVEFQVLGNMVSVLLSSQRGSRLLPFDTWMETVRHTERFFYLWRQHPDYCLRLARGSINEDVLDEEAQVKTSVSIVCSFLERLDDELFKTWQELQTELPAYQQRLTALVPAMASLWRGFCVFQSRGDSEELGSRLAVRILDHIAHRSDDVTLRLWEFVQKDLLQSDAQFGIRFDREEMQTAGDLLHREATPEVDDEEEDADEDEEEVFEETFDDVAPAPVTAEMEGIPADPVALPQLPNSQLVKTMTLVAFENGSERSAVRAALHSVYNLAIQDRYFEARELFLACSFYELASSDATNQLLYNRVLTQLGLAAFRAGEVQQAHQCLLEICSFNRHRELLGQAGAQAKGTEKTAEQELVERHRLLPYHLHMNIDSIEAVHNLAAMLIMSPIMAAKQSGYQRHLRSLNRHFLHQFDNAENSGFGAAAVENPRDVVMVATRHLARGDATACWNLVKTLKVWANITGSQDQQRQLEALFQKKISCVGLRTYLLCYTSVHDSYSVSQLGAMFGLSEPEIRAVVYRMMTSAELRATWDRDSRYVIVHQNGSNGVHTRLQDVLDKIGQQAKASVAR